jgi:limonene-1,2-epoxide hydrolase
MGQEAEIVRKFFESFERQEVDRLTEFFTEGATYEDTFYGSFTGRERIREMFRTFYRDGRDWGWKPRKIAAQPGCAMAEGLFTYVTADQRNPGRPMKIAIVSIFDFAGDRIKYYHEYMDVGPALLQMGLKPDAIARHLQKRLNKKLSYTIPET